MADAAADLEAWADAFEASYKAPEPEAKPETPKKRSAITSAGDAVARGVESLGFDAAPIRSAAGAIDERVQDIDVDPASLATNAARVLMPGGSVAARLGAAAGVAGAKDPETVEAVKGMAKDELAGGLAMVAGGPATMLGGPLVERPIRKLIKSQFPGEPETTVAQDVSAGLKEGATDLAIGGALAGAGAALRIPGAVLRRLDKSKLVNGLTKYVQELTTRGGDPRAIKSAAGKLMDTVIKEAGDTPVATDPFISLADDLAKSTQNPSTPRLDPIAEEIIEGANKLAAKGTMTIGEIQNGLAYWGRKVQSLKGNKSAQHIAKQAKDALDGMLDKAVTDPALGKVADALRESRGAYAKGAKAEKLQRLVVGAEDSLSLDKAMSPGKFAVANSGKRREEIERLVDPELLPEWRAVVDASKVLAKKGSGWVPEQFKSQKVADALNNLMTHRNVVKMFQADPETAKAAARLLAPPPDMTADAALALIAQVAARISRAGGDEPEAGPKQKPQPAKEPPLHFAGGKI